MTAYADFDLRSGSNPNWARTANRSGTPQCSTILPFFSRTIDAIARAAGVAVETVYGTFATKMEILKNVVDLAVVGDDEPVPLLERPEILATQQESDQRLLATFAGQICEIMSRMRPIFKLLREAGKTDSGIAALLDQLLAERLGGMGFLVEQFSRIGGLHARVNSEAAATAWVPTPAPAMLFAAEPP